METIAEGVVQPAPVVTKVETSQTESSHEQKVEQVANGTVESSVNETKTVTQSVQPSGDQTVQTYVCKMNLFEL